MNDSWQSGNAYNRFMGRWSTPITHRFLDWLAIPLARSWLDVGCGTGALTQLVLKRSEPQVIVAIDSSPTFISFAQQALTSPIVHFALGSAQSLPLVSGSVDALVSGLMLNFAPQPEVAVSEMMRVTKPGGTLGIFLWDYAEGMEMLRYFWDAAVQLDSCAREFDEGIRFPLCQQGQLASLVRHVGIKHVKATPIEITTVFKNFDDYWQPFLGKVGPAPSYTMSLNQEARKNLEDSLHKALPIHENGSIRLRARAWAVKGTA